MGEVLEGVRWLQIWSGTFISCSNLKTEIKIFSPTYKGPISASIRDKARSVWKIYRKAGKLHVFIVIKAIDILAKSRFGKAGRVDKCFKESSINARKTGDEAGIFFNVLDHFLTCI